MAALIGMFTNDLRAQLAKSEGELSMAPVVFPGNTVFCTFAAVERVDLLIAWLRGHDRWRVQPR